ncbi:MAG: manganese catalase family protein [Thermaerobacter sp.]|nr:manganese catalase family protein [Thermaerobacter sp.]
MFRHEAAMLFPVEVTRCDPTAASMLQEQFAGANSELKALVQYLVQSFGVKDPATRALLLNIATEEASHLEMVGTAIVQLMTYDAESRGGPNMQPNWAVTGRALQNAPSLLSKMVNLGGVGPVAVDSAGAPFSGNFINSTGDITSDLASDLAAELRARRVYQQLLKNTSDPGLRRTLEFLAEREATHSVLFGEALERVKDEGVAQNIGRTLISRRMPAVSDTADVYLRTFGAGKLPEQPLGEPIQPHEVEVQLAEQYEALAPIG